MCWHRCRHQQRRHKTEACLSFGRFFIFSKAKTTRKVSLTIEYAPPSDTRFSLGLNPSAFYVLSCCECLGLSGLPVQCHTIPPCKYAIPCALTPPPSPKWLDRKRQSDLKALQKLKPGDPMRPVSLWFQCAVCVVYCDSTELYPVSLRFSRWTPLCPVHPHTPAAYSHRSCSQMVLDLFSTHLSAFFTTS